MRELSVIEKFDPIYESFTNFALPRAIEMDANSSQTALEIVGLDSFGRKSMFSGVIKKTPLLSRFIKEFLPKEPKLAEPGVKDLPWRLTGF